MRAFDFKSDQENGGKNIWFKIWGDLQSLFGLRFPVTRPVIGLFPSLNFGGPTLEVQGEPTNISQRLLCKHKCAISM